ncbi:PEP-CTERM sorting domain-containing protein [Burkholderia vietnamiensis]|uniref:PEP-CTERM sorting domain-containing protein n=1 Tax=Burkholderia vietnamiensis TaxID=60552 RepID=UPI001D14E93C|nr:PEP-CTERM sorting domain-containing protein [Burkholderia vietnamiensis]UEC01666.1 PEP-CTERM sorting domain-containing protein [Burkholderia vietnamiensis]
MKFKSSFSVLVISGVLLSAASSAYADISYALRPLTLPSGTIQTGGMAVNDQGTALTFGLDSSSAIQALVYSNPKQSQLLTPPAGSSSQVVGYGINGLGQVVGTTGDSAGSHATLWSTPNAPGVSLGGGGSAAIGINDTGLVVGQITTADGRSRAAIFTTTGPIDIGGSSPAESAAYAVSNSGYVVGLIMSDNGYEAAWFDFPHSNVVTLGGLGGANSAAEAVNDWGLAAGFADLASGDTQATIFNLATGTAQGLGTLGGQMSYAYGINNLGQVVGLAETATGAEHYFLWDAQHGMQDLQSLIDPSSGWQISGVSDINNVGQIMATACRDGQCQAALLNPLSAVPEPSTWAFMVAGLGWVVARRRRC